MSEDRHSNIRAIRMSDALWDAITETAKDEESTASDYIRRSVLSNPTVAERFDLNRDKQEEAS